MLLIYLALLLSIKFINQSNLFFKLFALDGLIIGTSFLINYIYEDLTKTELINKSSIYKLDLLSKYIFYFILYCIDQWLDITNIDVVLLLFTFPDFQNIILLNEYVINLINQKNKFVKKMIYSIVSKMTKLFVKYYFGKEIIISANNIKYLLKKHDIINILYAMFKNMIIVAVFEYIKSYTDDNFYNTILKKYYKYKTGDKISNITYKQAQNHIFNILQNQNWDNLDNTYTSGSLLKLAICSNANHSINYFINSIQYAVFKSTCISYLSMIYSHYLLPLFWLLFEIIDIVKTKRTKYYKIIMFIILIIMTFITNNYTILSLFSQFGEYILGIVYDVIRDLCCIIYQFIKTHYFDMYLIVQEPIIYILPYVYLIFFKFNYDYKFQIIIVYYLVCSWIFNNIYLLYMIVLIKNNHHLCSIIKISLNLYLINRYMVFIISQIYYGIILYFKQKTHIITNNEDNHNNSNTSNVAINKIATSKINIIDNYINLSVHNSMHTM